MLASPQFEGHGGSLMKASKVFLTSELSNFVLGACAVTVFLGLSGLNWPKFFVLGLAGFALAKFSLVLHLPISKAIHLGSFFFFFFVYSALKTS